MNAFAWPEVDDRTMAAVERQIRSGRWAVASPAYNRPSSIDMVQRALSKLFGREYSIVTCNGTAAIVIALRALGIGTGATVLMPALTWVGCAAAVVRVGAKPYFVDSSTSSPLMDVSNVAAGVKVDAILAVHTYASMIDCTKLRERFPGVPVVEDFSHAHGGLDPTGAIAGASGDISICSFQASKLLTCGEGGAAFTDDPGLARLLEGLRTDARVRTTRAFSCSADLAPLGGISGDNYAMSEISAALLLDQIEKFAAQCQRRAQGVTAFLDALSALGFDAVYDASVKTIGSFYRLPVRCVSSKEHYLGGSIRYLSISTIPLDPMYPPIPNSPLWVGEKSNQKFDGATAWGNHFVGLPHEIFLGPTDKIKNVARALHLSISTD
jgi:dTDP-4-amino-4,6-dideoxygalactose transaminase